MDRDPSMARVVFDVPRHYLPDLLAYLGLFAVDHDLAISVNDAPDNVSEAGITVEELRYDSTLVSTVVDDDGQEVVIAARKDLAGVAKSQNLFSGNAQRILTGLRDASYTRQWLTPMLCFRTMGRRREVVGIKVGYVNYLEELISTGQLVLPNAAGGSTKLLTAYCDKLFSPDSL